MIDKFISPMRVAVSKFKNFRLNLNEYRNTHYRILNNAKINYKEVMKEQIENAPNRKKVIMVYTVWFGSKRSFDIGNVCSIHEKFFEDAYVELGKIEDDNADFVPAVVYLFGGVDKDNPRVEIEIMDYNAKSLETIYNRILKEVD